MNITEHQAKETLSPYQDDIRDCIVSAWKYYHDHFREIKHILSSRSMASIIFDFITHNVRQKFDGKRNVSISTKRGLFLVNFGNQVVLRFKKLRNNKASCIHTQQTLNFFCQLEIEDIPNPQRLVVGYQLNKIRTEIKAISVIYPQNPKQNYWTFDLQPVISSMTEDLQLHMPMEQDISSATEQRIIIKGESKVGVVENE
jgi:hypothetical protein